MLLIFYLFLAFLTLIVMCERNDAHILRDSSVWPKISQVKREKLIFLENFLSLCVGKVCTTSSCEKWEGKNWRVNDFVCSFLQKYVKVRWMWWLSVGRNRFEWPKSLYFMAFVEGDKKSWQEDVCQCWELSLTFNFCFDRRKNIDKSLSFWHRFMPRCQTP